MSVKVSLKSPTTWLLSEKLVQTHNKENNFLKTMLMHLGVNIC